MFILSKKFLNNVIPFSTDGLQIVFFQEDGRFSRAYNLTGKTDDNGYYLVGHPVTNVTIDLSLDRSKEANEFSRFTKRTSPCATLLVLYAKTFEMTKPSIMQVIILE